LCKHISDIHKSKLFIQQSILKRVMRAFALTNKGLEGPLKENIIEILGKDDSLLGSFQVSDGCVFFDIENYGQLCTLSYMCQAASRVMLHVASVDCKSIETHPENIIIDKGSIITALDLIPEDFRVYCINHSSLDIDQIEIEKNVGSQIFDTASEIGKKIKVNLKEPKAIFYAVLIGEKLHLGLDFSGDISKRDYKIFNSPMSLKGITAFGVLKMASFDGKKTLVDMFCNSGVIAIEAALYSSSISPKYYNKAMPFTKLAIGTDSLKLLENLDKGFKAPRGSITAADPLLRNITAAKKNAKIAGVDKYIDFRRIDIDWADIKYDKCSIDIIISFIPGSNKYKDNSKLYKEFFYQAEYILKNDGAVTILCLSKDLLIDSAKEYFKLTEERLIYSGEQEMLVLTFKKIN